MFVRFLPEVIRRLFKLWTPRLDPLPINRLHRIDQFRRLLGSRLPRVRSGKEVRVGDHSRKELGSFRVDCERLCRGLTKQTLFLARTPREIDTLNPSPILSAEKDSISPGDGSSGGDPGSERHPFAVWQIFGRRSKPHPQTILQWEFFLGLGDEKKRKNTCAHKFLFETTKTTSGSSIINTEKTHI